MLHTVGGWSKKDDLRYMIRERCHDTGLNCGWRRQRTLLWSRQQGYRVTLVWVYTSQWISMHLVTVSHALACRLCCIHRCTRLAIGAKSRSVNWNYAFSHATDRRAKHRYQPTHEWMAASCQTTECHDSANRRYRCSPTSTKKQVSVVADGPARLLSHVHCAVHRWTLTV